MGWQARLPRDPRLVIDKPSPPVAWSRWVRFYTFAPGMRVRMSDRTYWVDARGCLRRYWGAANGQ